MSFENNLHLLQENSKKLTNTSNDFEELVRIYKESLKLLEENKLQLSEFENKISKNNKSRKKINIDDLLELLEINKDLYQEEDIVFEDKIKLYKNTMSLILQAEDKLKSTELKIIDCN